MTNLGDLSVGVSADKGKLKTATLEIQRELEKAGDAAESSLRNSISGGAKAGTLAVRMESDKIRTVFEGLRGTIAAAFGVGIVVEFGKRLFNLASQNQELIASFTTLTKSEDEARRVLDEIAIFAANSPFNRLEIAKSTQQLIAFGLSADQALAVMRGVGEATSALGGSQEKFGGISLALGQIVAKGEVSGEEILQLAERGVPALDILREKLNLSAEEVQNIGNAGISSNEAIRALLEGIEERFGGSLEKASMTLRGRLSNIVDTLQEKVGEFGNSLDELFSWLLDRIAQGIEEFLPAVLLALSELLKTAGAIVASIYKSINDTFILLSEQADKSTNDQVSLLETLGKGYAAASIIITSGIKAVLAAAQIAGKAIGAFFAGMVLSVSDFGKVFLGVFGLLPETGVRVMASLGQAVNAGFTMAANLAINKINELISLLNKIPFVSIDPIDPLTPVAFPTIDDFLPSASIDALRDGAQGIADNFSGAFEGIGAEIEQVMDSTASDIQGALDRFASLSEGAKRTGEKRKADLDALFQVSPGSRNTTGSKAAAEKARKAEEVAQIESLRTRANRDIAFVNTSIRTAEDKKKAIEGIERDLEIAILRAKGDAAAAEKKIQENALKDELARQKEYDDWLQDSQAKRIRSIREGYSSLQTAVKDLEKTEKAYRDAATKYSKEVSDGLAQVGEAIEENDRKYRLSIADLEREARQGSSQALGDYIRDAATREAAAKAQLARLDEERVKELELARVRGEGVDGRALDEQSRILGELAQAKERLAGLDGDAQDTQRQELQGTIGRLQAELETLTSRQDLSAATKALLELDRARGEQAEALAQAQEAIRRVSEQEIGGKRLERGEVEKLVELERERAGLSEDARGAADLDARIAAIEQEAAEKAKAAEKERDDERAHLDRRAEIYRYFREKQGLTDEEYQKIVNDDRLKTDDEENRILILKLAEEKAELTRRRDERIALEQEVADRTKQLSNDANELLRTNVRSLKDEYRELIDEVNAAIAAQKELSTTKNLPTAGFSAGGYTGQGSLSEVAGVVHRGEYVVPNHVLQKIPGLMGSLEQARAGNIDNSRKIEITGPMRFDRGIDFRAELERALFRI